MYSYSLLEHYVFPPWLFQVLLENLHFESFAFDFEVLGLKSYIAIFRKILLSDYLLIHVHIVFYSTVYELDIVGSYFFLNCSFNFFY